MHFHLEKYHRNISDQELIYDLKRFTKELKKNPVTIDEYNERGEYHLVSFMGAGQIRWSGVSLL